MNTVLAPTSRLAGMLRTTLLAAGIGALATPAASQESALSYTYLRGGYVSTSIDGPGDIDGDGVGLDGAFALTERFFLLGGATFQEFDFEVDVARVEFGVGARLPLAPGLDAIGTVSYLHTEVDAGPADSDDDAIGLGLGVRGRLTDAFELEGGLKYADLDVFRDDLSVNVAGRYYLTPQFALGAGVEAGDDVATWNVGVRYDFR